MSEEGAAKLAGIPLAGQDVVERIGVVGKGGSIEVGVVNGVDTPLKGAEKEGKAEEKAGLKGQNSPPPNLFSGFFRLYFGHKMGSLHFVLRFSSGCKQRLFSEKVCKFIGKNAGNRSEKRILKTVICDL